MSTLELRYEMEIAVICRTFQKLLWRKYKLKHGAFFPFYYEACNTIVMYIFTQLILVYNVTMSNATIKLKFNTIFMGNKYNAVCALLRLWWICQNQECHV